MEIKPTTTAELANHLYQEIEPGMYHAPGRVLIVNADESALLILTETAKQ